MLGVISVPALGCANAACGGKKIFCAASWLCTMLWEYVEPHNSRPPATSKIPARANPTIEVTERRIVCLLQRAGRLGGPRAGRPSWQSAVSLSLPSLPPSPAPASRPDVTAPPGPPSLTSGPKRRGLHRRPVASQSASHPASLRRFRERWASQPTTPSSVARPDTAAPARNWIRPVTWSRVSGGLARRPVPSTHIRTVPPARSLAVTYTSPL